MKTAMTTIVWFCCPDLCQYIRRFIYNCFFDMSASVKIMKNKITLEYDNKNFYLSDTLKWSWGSRAPENTLEELLFCINSFYLSFVFIVKTM